MKVKSRVPLPQVRKVRAAPVVETVTSELPSTPGAVPLRKAEPGALVQGSTATPAGPTQRPEAAWSSQAREIASSVLAKLPPGTQSDRVAKAMELLLAEPALQNAEVSCTVLGASAEILAAHRGAEPTNPCSNAKVVTAAWALSVLGPAHRFQTTIALSADDSLVVSGRFDPSMTTATIEDIARALRAKGITEVPRLVLDVSAMQGSNVPASFGRYGEEDWEYLARPEPLSVDKNLVQLTITPGEGPGAPAHVVADTGAFSVRARVQTIAAKSEFKVGCDELDAGGVLERDASGKALLDVWGTIASDYQKGKSLTMKSPAPLEQVGFAWRDALERAGLKVGSVEVGGAIEGARVVHEHRSKPLASLLQTSLATSNAFDHEMFALATAHAEAGGPVTLKETAARLTTFLRSLGVEGELVNGSGIGNDSRIPAIAVATLLARARSDARLAPLLAGLAEPGQTGTLKGRMLGTAAEGKFHGKTGTGERAVALSGVCGDLVMSLLVEDMKSRRDDVRAVLDACAIVLSSIA